MPVVEEPIMSLFENEEYRWRDTYFVLFHSQHRPSAGETLQALEALGPRFQVQETRCDEDGRFESLTLVSPDDFSAMDISFICGDEVEEQVATLLNEGKPPADEQGRAAQMEACSPVATRDLTSTILRRSCCRKRMTKTRDSWIPAAC